MIAIYILIDPRTGAVRYVGKAKDLSYRLKQHCVEKYKSKKTNWVKRLKSLGMIPTMEVLETVDDEHWQEAERFWIAFFKSAAAELLNMTNGGDGVSQTPEIRRKISESHKGLKHSKESLEKMRSWKRSPMTPEQLEKHTAFHKARTPHPNSIAALAEHCDHTKTPEQIEKHRAAMTGYKWSKEALRNRADGVRRAIKGKPRSDADKAKMSSGWAARRLTGAKRKPRSPEAEKRRVASLTVTLARKRHADILAIAAPYQLAYAALQAA